MDSLYQRDAGIQYGGLPGISRESQAAVLRLLQFGDTVTHARLLTHVGSHCFVLTINTGELVAIKSGFTSGYSGEGSRTLSYVLHLLNAHGAEIDEFEVPDDFLARIDASALTRGDLLKLDKARPVRPNRWYQYVYPDHWEPQEIGGLWREFPHAIPWAIVDSRISDLAIRFWRSPDECLMTGYRRLEDLVRARAGLKEHGSKLYSAAFHGPVSKLQWDNIDEGEQAGRAQLFTGSVMAFRNPRAHREPDNREDRQLTEFLLLNQMFILEGQAIVRPEV